MSLHTLSEWLRCPICLTPLTAFEPLLLRCEHGHSFDVNKRGFVTMLRSHGLIGDSAAMLDARASFLNAGWYAPLLDAVSTLSTQQDPADVLDIGCGTGYYLGGVLERSPAARALAFDISPAAVSRTVRSHPHVDGLVADVWSALPIRGNSADLILNVFAPRNAAEFARILRPDGLMIVVIPQDSHLRELRDTGLALGVQQNKATQLVDSLADHFAVESRQKLDVRMDLTQAEIMSLVGMGPSAHHQGETPERGDDADNDAGHRQVVTAAFEIFGFRPRHTSPAAQ
ncbi:methyltransferase domain-containing protein [Leifsonia sp. A12D58]|uniref:methyltransferase domain-containing protein n=1 Tax=Leifsonia sp. A12D58 TaxID=3397674 RepID=UPI0039E08E9A